MNRPSGRVTANTTAMNNRIWTQPLPVMSELLRPEHRVREVHEQPDRHNQSNRVVERHRLFQPLAGGNVCHGKNEEHDRDGDVQQIGHGHLSQRRNVESNVTMRPMPNRRCIGVRPGTPGLRSGSVKKPPPGPRESSTRYSSFTIACAAPSGFRNSTVEVNALTDCAAPIQRPSRSQANSGRTVMDHGPATTHFTGACAAIHNASGSLGTATPSVPIWYSNAAVTGPALRSTMLSEKKRQCRR